MIIRIMDNRTLVAVCCAPKVGSTALVSSLRISACNKLFILHSHGNNIFSGIMNGVDLNVSDVVKNADIRPVFLIDIYRLPIEQKISEFFHEIGTLHFNNTDENILGYSTEKITKRLLECWNFLAKERGAKSLGTTTALYGPYQAGGIFVMRPWAAAHASAVERYIAAYIEGCRAAQDPAQKALTLRVLSRELKLDANKAEMTYQALNDPSGSGLSKDCALDMQGFKNVLALRAEIEGQWGGKAPAPEKFLDLSYFNRALQHTMP